MTNKSGRALLSLPGEGKKPVNLLKKLIEIFTDEGEVVIDPTAGSGSTIVASIETNRKAYGFEIKKDFHADAKRWIDKAILVKKEIEEFGYSKSEASKYYPILFD